MPYSNVAVDEHLINAPYYQGFQTKIEADGLLPKKNGTFLVRLIEQNWGELVSSIFLPINSFNVIFFCRFTSSVFIGMAESVTLEFSKHGTRTENAFTLWKRRNQET